MVMGSGLLAPSHIVLLALVALLLFGPKRLPEIGRSLGRGMREFRDSVSGQEDQNPGPEQPALEVSAAVAARPAAEPENDAAAPGPPSS
jgi:sec-independent protein translocase protein TatA